MRVPRLWIHVPIGDAREEDDKADDNLLSKVRVKYHQFSFDLCLIKGLASGLLYMDLHHEASCLINKCNMPVDPGLCHLVKKVKKHMLDYAKPIGIGIDYNSTKQFGKLSKRKRERKITLEEIIKEKSPYPYLVIPMGKDDGVNHAVCVVDDLIFDSTQHFVLKLCHESFDWICGDGGCKGVYFAIHFNRGKDTETLKCIGKRNSE